MKDKKSISKNNHFLLIAGLPRSGTRQLTDILNGLSDFCIQGEITIESFNETNKYIKSLLESNYAINRSRLRKRGALLYSQAIGLVGKFGLRFNPKSYVQGFKCPHAQSWYKELLEIAELLDFDVYIILCIRELDEIFKSLVQMPWYNGGITRFVKIVNSLISDYEALKNSSNPRLKQVSIFNLNTFLTTQSKHEYINAILGNLSQYKGQLEIIIKAIELTKNTNATANIPNARIINQDLVKQNKKIIEDLNDKFLRVFL